MALTKLNIEPLDRELNPHTDLKPFDVLFNPNTYSIVKPVTWTQHTAPTESGGAATAANNSRDLNAPQLVFGGGGSRTLTLQLFFDVTERGTDADVRTETNKIRALTRIQGDQAEPPVCRVSWGKETPENSDFPFDGVATNLTQNFVMFRASGQPVRANLTVVFTEFINPKKDKQETDPELTTYLVKRGDTLSAIAARLYRGPTLWRTIAEANDIDDPRHLQIGARLVIPRQT